MPKFVFTKKAVADLTEIWNYTYEKWSEKQADKYYNEILVACKKITVNPENGKSYYLLADLKGYKINKHIIFYREQKGNMIEIERILHERMDLTGRLKDNI